MLEIQLDKVLAKYNEALGHNKKLRGTIDNLWREHIVFDDSYQKLENDLLTIKNEMASIINEADAAYISRDHAHMCVPRPEQFENESTARTARW